MPRRAIRVAGKLALALISALATVALVEGGARYLQLHALFFIYPSPANCMWRSAELLTDWRPNCSGMEADTVFHTNSLGQRGPEPSDGATRILTIGDSCTWGWGATDDESYPAVLQQLLTERYGAQRYQVMNAGMPGYTSQQGLTYLRERGPALKPAIVIASYGFNDAILDGEIGARITEQRQALLFMQLDDFLLYRSYFYRWARSQWYRQHERELVARVDPAQFAANLNGIIDVARGLGARTMFIDFLEPAGLSAPYSRAVEELAAAQRLPIVTYSGERLDIVHPTPAGYRRLAGHVLEQLEAAGYLANPS